MSDGRAGDAAQPSPHAEPVEADANRDPDYRMSLAAERTYLAYLRTGLAMTAAGVAVAAALPDAHAVGLRHALGAGMVLAGAAAFAGARPRWAAIVRAMERGQPLPRTPLANSLAVALTAAAFAALVVVLLA